MPGEMYLPDQVTVNLSSQYGALPWRSAKGHIEVLLVTSRISRHWLIPKGWPMEGKSAAEAAAIEAYEEAGVLGETSKSPIGAYAYDKITKTGDIVPCRVDVYGLKVTEILTDWPERQQRQREWFTPDQAAELVKEADLGRFLGRVGGALKPVEL